MKNSSNKYVKALLNLATALAGLLLLILLVPKVIGFFMPFVVGWVIASIANPMVRFLDEKIKIRRKAGSAIVIIAAIALVVLGIYWIGAILLKEIGGFVRGLPDMWHSMESDMLNAGKTMENLARYFPAEFREKIANITNSLMEFVGNIANHLSTPAVTAVGNFAKVLPSVFVSVIMCLLSSYFFVAQREEVVQTFRKYVPEGYRHKWAVLYNSLKSAVGGYFKAQFRIEIWIYILLVFGLFILKVNYVLVIALGIAVLDFLPVFGTGTVLIPWAVIKVLGGDYKMAVGLLITWGVGQLVRQLIQPKIVGDSVGVPAIPTLFLLFIGYRVGSVLGMILAVPAGIILVNMYEAGFFDTTMDSLRILITGFNHFRRLTDEDKKDIMPARKKGGSDGEKES